MMKSRFLMLFALCSVLTFAQTKFSKEQLKEMDNMLFEETFSSVSPKKTSIVVTKDGKTHKGFCRDLDRKRGQIYEITLKDSISGQQESFPAENVAEAHLFAGGFEKVAKMNKFLSNSRNWGTKSAGKNFKSDRIPFINEQVSLKNKDAEKTYLMQLINPTFSSKIKVYGDPFASETTTFSVGGVGVSGGVTKSYYVKKDGKVFWLEKSSFKDNYNRLFGDNAAFMQQYPLDAVKWDYLSYLVFKYDEMSQ